MDNTSNTRSYLSDTTSCAIDDFYAAVSCMRSILEKLRIERLFRIIIDDMHLIAVNIEEEDKPKYKAPRPERKCNKLNSNYRYIRNKNSRKIMYGSQKWNR